MQATKHSIKSFGPISNHKIQILILGSIPGLRSLELNEYYGHPRNRFWKMISKITNNDVPITYSEKKSLLLNSKIGVWDVAKKAIRKGSLDNAIKNEEPNDLESFFTSHPHLKVIGFNGSKAEALYKKHFTRKEGIIYISLPSTSPANAGIDFENLCKRWEEILKLA